MIVKPFLAKGLALLGKGTFAYRTGHRGHIRELSCEVKEVHWVYLGPMGGP